MDETTKQALNAFVQQMIASAQTGAQWTADQAPQLVREWLVWQSVNSAIWSLAFVWLTVVVWVKLLPWARRDRDDDFEKVMAWIIYAGLQALSFVAMAVWVESFLKVTLAPRVAVLEKFASLVK